MIIHTFCTMHQARCHWPTAPDQLSLLRAALAWIHQHQLPVFRGI